MQHFTDLTCKTLLVILLKTGDSSEKAKPRGTSIW